MTNKSLLSTQDLLNLQDRWLRKWRDSKMPAGGMAELWFDVVTSFLAWRGDRILPGSLTAAETRITEAGLADEYFRALIDVVKPPTTEELATQAVYLILATPDQRFEAAKRILERTGENMGGGHS